MGIAEHTKERSVAAAGGAPTELATLLNATAVRERCSLVLRWVAAGRSQHFVLDQRRLADVADYVAAVTRAAYPDLDIPLHSRWRHFSAAGIERWAANAQKFEGARERARAAIDLATISVLLDAGAGDRWRYCERATGLVFARSEGLAIASLDMFTSGLFSSYPNRPLQVDAAALKSIDAAKLARGLQATADNPLIGLERRVALLHRLGQELAARTEIFGSARPGDLADHLARRSADGCISAPLILNLLLETFSAIWPSGHMVGNFSVGDAGRHPAVSTGDATDCIVPFHKLSQWLVYSLIEPLAIFDLTVVDVGELTALAEYRNGGLLIDLGVISPRNPVGTPQNVSSEFVVEWRALTVTLMDELLGLVRQRLNLDAAFNLPQLLQGGTWAAGRKIACALRPPLGPSPIPLITDGTIF